MNDTQSTKPLDGAQPAKKSKPPGVRKWCFSCRQEETSTSPFVRCACTRSWHITCSSPNVELIAVGSVMMYKLKGGNELYKDFVCKRCKDEGRNVSTSAGDCSIPGCGKAIQLSDNIQQVFCQEHESKQKAVEAQKHRLQNGDTKTCEHPSCDTPIDIFKMNSSAKFCSKHKTAMLFEKAKKATVPTQPPPEARPFKKKKLYPLNDEGKAILKEQKASKLHRGKQPKFKKTVSSQTAGPEVSKAPSRADKRFMQGLDSPSNTITSRLPTASNSGQTITPSYSEQQPANVDLQQNANATPPTTVDTPIHTFGPEAPTETEEDDPSSQLAKEIQATMPPAQVPVLRQQPDSRTSMGLFDESRDLAMTCDQSIEFAKDFLKATGNNETADKDEEDDDDDGARLAYLVPPTTISAGTIMSERHVPSNKKPRLSDTSTVAPTLPESEAEAAEDEEVVGMPLPANSLELARAQKAANFNSLELDSWLANQTTLTDSDIQPSTKDLLETQKWGNVDPRKAWPPVFSQQWLEDKKAEIEARGGRKASFGKIITAKGRREREARGWNIHQSEASKVLTEERMEVRRRVDELFGVKDVDDMVPRVDNNGFLFMVDAVDQQGKGKKAERIFQVG